MSTETVTIPRPHVPYGPAGVDEWLADADYLRSAARAIEFHRLFGSNLNRTVAKLLRDAADAVAGQEPTASNALAMNPSMGVAMTPERLASLVAAEPCPTCSGPTLSDAQAARNATGAALDDLHGRIFALSMQWLRDQAEYPDTREGRAAAAAVRLCGQEMTAALATRPAPVVSGDVERGAMRIARADAWDEGWDASIAAYEQCPVTGGLGPCGAEECSICSAPNPYRTTIADEGRAGA